MKSLRYQLNSRILILSICIFFIGGIITFWQAKRAVQEEIQSSIHLAVQLITFNLSQNNARTNWLAQLNALNETRHLQIQLKEATGNVLTISQTNSRQMQSTPPKWFVNLIGSSSIQVERTLLTSDGQALIVSISANPLTEIGEVWRESSVFFGLLFLFITLIFLVIQLVFNRVLKEISMVVEGLERIESENYEQQLPDFNSAEVNCIANAINQLIDKLKLSQAKNRALTQHNLEIQEQERQRLAQELHDELGQSLTAIKVMTVTIVRTDQTQNLLIQQSTHSILEICDHLMRVVRLMMKQLHPLVLTELGLKAALEELISHWKTHYSHLNIKFEFDENGNCLSENISIHIFRIVQEGLTNIVRHANATQILIKLTFNENKNLILDISDNGQGGEMQHIKKGFGLLSMREPVRSLNGDFLIEIAPQRGMKIKIKIPL